MILHEIKLAFMKRDVPYRITTIGVSVTTSCYVELMRWTSLLCQSLREGEVWILLRTYRSFLRLR